MTTKPSYTPALRFPDFLNDGEWEVKRLGDCLIQPPDYGLNAPAVPFSDNLPTYLRITDISDDGCFIKEGKASVDTVLTNENSLQEGDIVFARTGASVGKVYKYRKEDGPLVFAGFLIRIKPDNTKLDSDFLFQFLFSNTYKRWVEVTSTRSGQPGINSVDIASLPIPFPPLPEQRRIAQALTALDELIAATNEKLEQMKAYKKGLMQQLFVDSMGGGKSLKINHLQIPKLRFPEFYEEKEWEEKKLGEIIITITPKKKMQTGDYKLTGKHPIIDQSQSYICGYCDDDAALANSNSEQMIVFGDHTCTLKFVDFPFIQGADGIKVFKSSNSNVVDERFLYQFLLFKPIVSKEYKRHFSELKEKTVCLPVNVSEQCKIASCLSAMDETINAYTEKVGLLGQYKKGLMQQMFPQNQMN